MDGEGHMQRQKEAAARAAAARYASDKDAAVALYAALTGQAAACAAGGSEELEEEMLSLLPAYRHPVHDASTEYILFVDPAGVPAEKPGTKKSAHPFDRPDDVDWLHTEWQCCVAELVRLEERAGGNRSGRGQADVVGAGGSETPVSGFRRQRAYQCYIRLVRSKGLSRQAALQAVQTLYGFSDDKATLQALKAEREEVIRRWQEQAPCLVETILSRWQGLLPEA
jgi:hypothetical protein